MQILVLLNVLILLIIIPATINAVIEKRADDRLAKVQTDLAKKIAVLQWVDEREVLQQRLARQVAEFRSLGAVQHVGAIDGIWTDGRFGSRGPRTFVPSATGINQINLAMEILQERENLLQQMRDGAVRTYGQLANWEKQNPMPDVGEPYPPMEKPTPPKQDTKPAPRAFLDAPIYTKELTR